MYLTIRNPKDERGSFVYVLYFNMFCENANLLTEDQLLFQAVAASFQHHNSKCLKLLKQYLYAYIEKHTEQSGGCP